MNSEATPLGDGPSRYRAGLMISADRRWKLGAVAVIVGVSMGATARLLSWLF